MWGQCDQRVPWKDQFGGSMSVEMGLGRHLAPYGSSGGSR